MKPRVLIVGFAVVLAMLACQPRFVSKLEPKLSGETGHVQMKIAAISTPLAKALGVVPQKTGPASKTYLIVTRVDLQLFLDAELYAEKTVLVSSGPGGGMDIEWPMVPAADGYTLEAWIYNGNVSEAEPLLHGVSEAFSVVSGGETEVTIRPTPIAPLAAPLAPSVAHQTLYTCWDTGEVEEEGFAVDPGPDDEWGTDDDIIYHPPIYGWAEERWFEIDATGYDAIRVNADVSADCGVYMLVADEWGRVRAQALSGAMDNGPAYWTYGGVASAGVLTPDSTYYVGLVTVSNVIGSSVLSSVDVNFVPFADDAYEENDSIAAACTVSKSTVYDCIDLDPVDWYVWPATGGDWYKFDITAMDDPNVTVAIAFDHDVCDLALELYRWVSDPQQIGQSDESEISGPGEPATEMELIEATLVPGTYYIWVHGNNTNGSSYELQWVAGTGTIIIGLE
jgi:hypothetical protein